MTLPNGILRALPLIVIVSVFLVASVAYAHDREELRKLSIPEMYLRAGDFENGEYVHYDKALKIYSQIIQIDKTEEIAWHEKGRILNHLNYCSEAFHHYVEYVKQFSDSSRASEGFEIAKICDLSEKHVDYR